VNSRTRLILIGLSVAAALFFLWPTYQYYQMDTERSALLSDSVALRRWDSLNKNDYRKVGAKRLKLGLDLRGGMYITMEVDAPALLLESAQRESVDETFQKVIDATRTEAATSDEQVIEIFRRNFAQIAGSQGRSLLNYYDFGDLGSNVNDEAIIGRLSKNIDDAVDQAVEVIRQRIDKFGVSEVTIQKVGGRRVIIELPGVTDEAEIRSLLSTTARLEFKLVKNNADAANLFRRIDDQLAGKVSTADTTKKVDTAGGRDTTNVAKADTTGGKDSVPTTAKADTAGGKDSVPPVAKNDTTPKAADTGNPYAGLSEEETRKAYQRDHPFTSLFISRWAADEKSQGQDIAFIQPAGAYPAGEYYFSVPGNRRADVMALLHRPDIRSMFPDDIIVAFSAAPEAVDPSNPDNSLYAMYVLTRDPELTGEVVTDARTDFDPATGRPSVSMQMSADGAAQWGEITGRNLKKRVAIVLDSNVYSAPVVQSKITGGSSQITGSSDVKEANLLAVVLKAGALKAPIKIIEERIVGASLGEDSIEKGMFAMLLGAAVVMIFMVMYYSFGGVIADLAVLLNLLLTIAILAAFGATLTLPGIGGLVLTIAMAVDGNILIYERIREELANGKSLKTALQLGYEKAFAAIIDTHVTTFMTGAILYFFGSGPIRGFAVTLMIGIAATLFTAVFCTRTVFQLMVNRGTTNINFGQPKAQERPVTV
jgi:SecD/SecF fusion protein